MPQRGRAQVLQDPRQKRFFKAKDMSDLFVLAPEYATATETAGIFAGVGGDVVPTAAAHAVEDSGNPGGRAAGDCDAS